MINHNAMRYKLQIDVSTAFDTLFAMSHPLTQAEPELDPMNKIVLTTEIDAGLNQALEEIARFDNRTASDLADQAIRNLVEERVATRELLHHGLRLVDAGNVKAVDSGEVHDWLLSDQDDFPAAR